MTSQRRRELVRILHEERVASQQQVVHALRDAGFHVTQATVSRDLRAIGAVKTSVDGELVYRLPQELPHPFGADLTARNLFKTLQDFAVDIAAAGNLVVIKTAPGHAAAVARAIDFAAPAGVLGTVAGDDTIFVAAVETDAARALATHWGEQTPESADEREAVTS